MKQQYGVEVRDMSQPIAIMENKRAKAQIALM